MPELPEVETVAEGLRQIILGKTIKSIQVRSPKINKDNKRGWTKTLIGQKPLSVRRRGKNILIDFTGEMTLWTHLKMTGHFYYYPETRRLDKHDHLIINFNDDKCNLRFNDYRKFGRIRLFLTSQVMHQKGLVDLGPEPLTLSPNLFAELLKSSHRMIKPALLDQTFIAGLGNIYVDESLFAARIHPRKPTDSISNRKSNQLLSIIKRILRKAIRNMGTSVDSFTGLNGQSGGYQKYLAVYGNHRIRCTNCGGRLRHEKIGSRTAHYCPRCQRIK